MMINTVFLRIVFHFCHSSKKESVEPKAELWSEQVELKLNCSGLHFTTGQEVRHTQRPEAGVSTCKTKIRTEKQTKKRTTTGGDVGFES